MQSKTSRRFREAYAALPETVQRQARLAYRRFKENPYHPGLRFKQVHTHKPVYAVRINRQYRALSVKQDDTLIWFWIGNHSDYDALLKQQS